MNYLALSYV